MKILIVKLSSLGDVVHAMPAVQDIARAFPEAQIDWVVERGFAPLARRCKGVHRVIACELRRWRKDPLSAKTRREWRAFRSELQQERYDAVIDLQGLSKSALVSWLAKLTRNGKRYSMANQTEGSSFEAPARWVADVAIQLPAHSHAVTRARELCAKALGYTLPFYMSFGLLAQAEYAHAAIKNIAIKAGLKGVVALVHGTSRADKQWPLSHWRELAHRLNAAGFGVALPHGSDAEEALAQDIGGDLPHAQVWPRLPLDALTDALATCAGVIGVDSGLSHIAVALDLPHVQIYNFDTAWRTGPLPVQAASLAASKHVLAALQALRQQHTPRQCSVFESPTPSVDAVWQAWESVEAVPTASFCAPFSARMPLKCWLYSLLMRLAQPLLRRKLRRRGAQEPGYLVAIDERFGHYTQTAPPPADGNTVWIHAVSLGETRAAAVLVAALRDRLPGMRLLLTHGTATGRAEGAKLLQLGDLQAWQPWDTPDAAQRFLDHFKPRIGILMETEIWPNLVHTCQQNAVPLVLANARLSDKSLRQAQRLAWLARPAYAALTAVWSQTPADAARLKQLGAPVDKPLSGIMGNLKFDATPAARQLETGRSWRAQLGKPVVMFASSREGEELALLQILKDFRPLALAEHAQVAINSIATDVQWLIVPRHPQRFDAVAALVESQGFAVLRRSSWGALGPAPSIDSTASADSSVNVTQALTRMHRGSSTPEHEKCSSTAIAARQSMPLGSPGLPRRCAPRNDDSLYFTLTTPPVIWLGDSLGEMALYYGLSDVALLGGSFEPLGGQNLIEAAACGCPVVMGPHTFNFAEAAEQALEAGAALRVTDVAQAMTTVLELLANSTHLHAAEQACDEFAQAHRGATQRLAQAIGKVLAASSGRGMKRR